MKIGIDTGPPGPEVRLPIEVIDQVISHITRLSSSSRTLWSCCLLSHDWYNVTIPYLYEGPRLMNKNFDLFTNTMCPKVNSHVRNIGLAHLVKRLDMGRLAYESSNSLTARLIGRVRHSLEEFVAPSVTFSVSCLAPLSKSNKLKVLDLSRVYQCLDLPDLLYSTRNLTKLTHLALPDTIRSPPYGWSKKAQWPPILEELRCPGWLLDSSIVFDMVAAWPPTLTQITIKYCLASPLLVDRSGYESVIARSMKSITLQESRHISGELHLRRVFTIFPSLISLSLPARLICIGWPIGFPDVTDLDIPLERLELTKDIGDDEDQVRLKKHDLLQCVTSFPKLWQITLEETCLTAFGSSAEEQFYDCDDITLALKQRASDINRLEGHEKINMDEAGYFISAN